MIMDDDVSVRIGTSLSGDEKVAVRELLEKIGQPDMEAVLFFCSSQYDLPLLAKELKATFPCKVIGCTTAGEISAAGFQEGGIVAASIASPHLRLHSRLITPLGGFGLPEAKGLSESFQNDLVVSNKIDRSKIFGFLMVDGMSALEEHLIASLYHQFEGISITGGSAGDDLCFVETKVYWEGEFLSDAAVFTLFETSLPFYVFQTQHCRPTDKKLVITGADPARRLVTEIDAEPAAQGYADLLGIPKEALTPGIFSNHPLMLKVGDRWYVRSILKANPDGSLLFHCAIDKGLVLTVGEGHDMAATLKDGIEKICGIIPEPALIIAFDCILRKLEILEKGIAKDMEQLISGLNLIGFNTYGEQFGSIHINQTLTGVAIGRRIRSALP